MAWNVTRADLDTVKQVYVDQGRVPVTQALGVVAELLGYPVPEFPRTVRDLLAASAGTGSDYPDWSKATLLNIRNAFDTVRAQLAV